MVEITDGKNKKPKTMDELLNEIDKNFEEAVKNFSDAADKIADVLVNYSPSESLEFANALAEGDIHKKTPAKKGILDRLLKMRGKKAVALLATLGVIALGGILKSNGKESVQSNTEHTAPTVQHVTSAHTTQDKTLAVLDMLAQDPHAFDGIELKDSIESDCALMNARVLDAIDKAFRKAGYIDEAGNLKPMKMVDISGMDALSSLRSGLQSPKIYKGKE